MITFNAYQAVSKTSIEEFNRNPVGDYCHAFISDLPLLLIYTFDDIHPGRVRLTRPTALCELTRNVHPVFSPSCVVEDSRPGERFQVFSWPPVRLLHERGGVGKRVL